MKALRRHVGECGVRVGRGEVLAAGFRVGVGSRYAGGCTSGHGVCSLSRGSVCSLAATVTWTVTGVLPVFVQRYLCWEVDMAAVTACFAGLLRESRKRSMA